MIENWINAHPKVRDTILWQEYWYEDPDDPNKGAYPKDYKYEEWPVEMKEKLENNYNRIVSVKWINVRDPPPNQKTLEDTDWPVTQLSHEDAKDIYFAHVAQSLAVETQNWVNWSILNYKKSELELLFDSRKFFTLTRGAGGKDVYLIDQYTLPHITPGSPSLPFALMRQGSLIDNTPLKTIGNLLDWCRNLVHYGLPTESYKVKLTRVREGFWQYRGYAPVKRVIEGTFQEFEELGVKDEEKQHWTAGCHGTGGLLYYILRTVNIPVILNMYEGHTQAYFPTVDRWLGHGDDPYGYIIQTAGFPGEYFLMDSAKYNKLYVKGEVEKVGIHTEYLMYQYLPLRLVHARVKDWEWAEEYKQVTGKDYPPEDFKIRYKPNITDLFFAKSQYNTPEMFERIKEWKVKRLAPRLDEKIEAYGGPDKVPETDDYLWSSWEQVLGQKRIRERFPMIEKAKKDFANLKRKRPSIDTSQLEPSTAKARIPQPSTQPSKSRKPGRKGARPPIKEPIPPKEEPRKKLRRLKKPISDKQKKTTKEPPTKKKPPSIKKKEAASEKEKSTSDIKSKNSLRKRVTKRLRKIVRRG